MKPLHMSPIPRKQVTQARPAPWAKLHAVYGVGELSKVALLGALVWQLVGGGGA